VGADFDYVLTTNDALNNATSEYEAATVIHSTIEVDGYGEFASLVCYRAVTFFFFLLLRVELNRFVGGFSPATSISLRRTFSRTFSLASFHRY